MSPPVDIHALANGLLGGHVNDIIEETFDETYPGDTDWGYHLPQPLRDGSLPNFLDALASVCISTVGQREKVAVTLTEHDDSVTLHIAHTEHAEAPGETLVDFVRSTWAILQRISDAHHVDDMPTHIKEEVVLPTHPKYAQVSVPLLAIVYRRGWPKIISRIEKRWDTFRETCSKTCSEQPPTKALRALVRAPDYLAGVKSLLSRDDLQSDDRVAVEVFNPMYELQLLCSYSMRNLLHWDKYRYPLRYYVWECTLHFFHITNMWLFAKSPLAGSRRLFTKELRIEYLVSPNRAIQYPTDDNVWIDCTKEIYRTHENYIIETCLKRVPRMARRALARGPTRVHPECLLFVHHRNQFLNSAATGDVRYVHPLENYIGCSKQRPCYMCAQFFRAYGKVAPPGAPEFKTRVSVYRLDGSWAMPEMGDAELESKIRDRMYRPLCADLIRCLHEHMFGCWSVFNESGEGLDRGARSKHPKPSKRGGEEGRSQETQAGEALDGGAHPEHSKHPKHDDEEGRGRPPEVQTEIERQQRPRTQELEGSTREEGPNPKRSHPSWSHRWGRPIFPPRLWRFFLCAP